MGEAELPEEVSKENVFRSTVGRCKEGSAGENHVDGERLRMLNDAPPIYPLSIATSPSSQSAPLLRGEGRSLDLEPAHHGLDNNSRTA